MRLRETIRVSLEALTANRFRAVLTILGMTIGVASIVLLVSVGDGAKRYVLGEFEGLGTNLIIIQPGKSDKRSKFAPPVGSAQRKMTTADVEAIQKRALSLDAVSGVVFGSGSLKRDESSSNITIFGVNDQFTRILNLQIALGGWFTREEDDYGRRVTILGARAAANLFEDEAIIGRPVRINDSEFRVIGVLASVGDKLGMNLDDVAFIPTRSAQRLFNDDKLLGIRARASSKSGIDDAVAEISEILRERRDGKDDFTVVTQGAIMESMSTILDMLTYVLAAIATISMLVAGIGIMNIMLVSVTERTGEIGVRRAVGARRRDILKQFLAEALMLSLLGGTAGLLISGGLTAVGYYFYPTFDMRPPFWILPPAFLLSVIVGALFGVWPARKASMLETLEALRHE